MKADDPAVLAMYEQTKEIPTKALSEFRALLHHVIERRRKEEFRAARDAFESTLRKGMDVRCGHFGIGKDYVPMNTLATIAAFTKRRKLDDAGNFVWTRFAEVVIRGTGARWVLPLSKLVSAETEVAQDTIDMNKEFAKIFQAAGLHDRMAK